METLDIYADPASLAGSEAGRIGRLLGLASQAPLDDISLADRISAGLKPASADALGKVLGRNIVIGGIVPEATLRRARKNRRALSREMSERLYEVSRVVDAVVAELRQGHEALDAALELHEDAEVRDADHAQADPIDFHRLRGRRRLIMDRSLHGHPDPATVRRQ